ncbi:OXA-62 family carbapenem-hydrolyzing class D beta-lactamase [Pandoraea sp. PE-S2T-3]|uniref:OXA-62 family carbapenem-hydrolyzing class D beta-lactamase n=1 Tax=Pandoraea sp. PE-S2T-3 TaxID=1986993 RepID=UPI000B404325|nr:OXA-62 family carbapenem-hydrolyzing class D beta-lactamase [Pandoraea sp. PE-S2T-3]
MMMLSRWRRSAVVLRIAAALLSPLAIAIPAHADAIANAANAANTAAPKIVERADWGKYFEAEGAKGTIIVLDGRTGGYQAYDSTRANQRMSPASTYKIFNSLLALESGALDNEREIIPWDGKPRSMKRWNAAMNLRDAFRVSCLPCYQVVSRKIPRTFAQGKLDAVGYGNHTIGSAADAYWVDNSLQISAREQVVFLQRLARGQLPFSARTQDIVRQISIAEANMDYVLHGKTGWYVDGKHDIGWWVGWIERDGNITTVALNMDMRSDADAPKRARIARAVLKDLRLI